MKHPAIPHPNSIIHEALVVVGGAIVAALIVGNLPVLRDFIKKQWADTPKL